MNRWVGRIGFLASAALVLAVTACSQQSGQSTSAANQPVEKTFKLMPAEATMTMDFLAGELQDLTVTERVDPKTGALVDRPELRGTLKLKNVSKDQSAQLVAAKLTFLDAKGQVIPLGKDRGDDSISFESFGTQRLNPGQDTSQTIDLPFPSAGLKPDDLHTVHLGLTYLPSQYREQSANYTVSLKG